MTSKKFVKGGGPPAIAGILLLCASSAIASSGIDILIEGNPKLLSLDGLEGVISLNSLAIKGNSSLAHLDGLRNLERVVGALDVQTNDILADCAALAPVLGWPDGASPRVGSAGISGNPSMCSTVQDIFDDVLPPTIPIITGHSFTLPLGSVGDSIIDMDLDFTRAREVEDIFPVTGHRATCNSADAQSFQPASPIPLPDFVPKSSVLEMAGSAGGDASAFVAEIEVGINITHTDPVDLLVTLKNPDGVPLILWDQSSPNSEDLVGTFPTTLSPEEPLSEMARERMGGEWTLIVEDIGEGPIIREGALNGWSLQISEESITDGATESPIIVEGVGHSASYSCTIAALSRLGATPVSSAYNLSVPRLILPTQPTIYFTDHDDSTVILHVSVSNNGGTPITRYDAICTDGTSIFTGTSATSRIIVEGLTNGVAYTCNVTATNSVGTSPASSDTVPIMPEETMPNLPAWLLYQATQ